MRKEREFRQQCCRNSTKVGERKRKSGREKFLISATPSPKFLLPILAARVGARSVSARKENQMWQWHCRNKKKKIWQLWQCHCREWEKKKIVVAKITCEELKKKFVTSTIFLQHFHNK